MSIHVPRLWTFPLSGRRIGGFLLPQDMSPQEFARVRRLLDIVEPGVVVKTEWQGVSTRALLRKRRRAVSARKAK